MEIKKSFESALLIAELLKDDLMGQAHQDQLDMAVDQTRVLYETLIIQAYTHRLKMTSQELVTPVAKAENYMEIHMPIVSEPEEDLINSVTEHIKQINLIDSIEEIKRQQEPISSGQRDSSKSLAERFTKKPIVDMKTAIPIHQKFLFVETLFNRDKAAYEQAIDAINKSVSFIEADEYMRNTLKTHYNWEMGHPVTEEFMELVERRFL